MYQRLDQLCRSQSKGLNPGRTPFRLFPGPVPNPGVGLLKDQIDQRSASLARRAANTAR